MFIVVEPCFAEGHILEAHVRNVCEYLCPDHLIVAEGMFPAGPENSLHGAAATAFRENYTLDGTRSFDIELMRFIIKKCQQDYTNTEIHWIEMKYDHGLDTSKAYQYVYTMPARMFSLKPEDIIFAGGD